MEKRPTRVTEGQWDKLLSFLEAHPYLVARGYNNSNSGRQISKRLWDNIAQILNSEPEGTFKTPKDWATYVSNFKCKLKKSKTDKSNETTETDGDSSQAKYLSGIEARFLSIMAQGAGSFNTNGKNELFPDSEVPELGHNQSHSLGQNPRFTYDLEVARDPLLGMPVKQEASWAVRQDDSDTRESDTYDAPMMSAGPLPAVNYDDASSTQDKSEEPKLDRRKRKRDEELHKLKIAERVWVLKTLRERHAAAQIERRRAHLERVWQLKALRERHATAQLERERAQLQRDLALLQLRRARGEGEGLDPTDTQTVKTNVSIV